MMKQIRKIIKNLTGAYMEEINKVLRMFRDKELEKKVLTYILLLQEQGELNSYEDMDILKDILISFALQKAKNINTQTLLKSTFLARCFEYRRGFWDKTISELYELIFLQTQQQTKTENQNQIKIETQEQKQSETVKAVEEITERETKENEENKEKLNSLFAFAGKVWERLKIPEKMPKEFVWALRDKLQSYSEEDILIFVTIFRKIEPAGGWKLFISQFHTLSVIAKSLKNQSTVLKSKLVNRAWETLIHKTDYISLEILPKLGQMAYKFIKSKIFDLSKNSSDFIPSLNSFLDKIFKEWSAMTETEKGNWRSNSKELMLQDAKKYNIQVVLDSKGEIISVNTSGNGVLA